MSKKLAKYIITTGSFDHETNNLKQARKELKAHVIRMSEPPYVSSDVYGIYMLIEKSK